jgi:type II secretory pathway component PulF
MPLIITPRQLEHRAELYHQLGIMLSAGLTFHQALEHLKRNPADRSLLQKTSHWLERLNEGYSVTEAARRLGNWMPSFDLALLEAGEQSGRLDACFKLLALYYRERAKLVKQTINDLVYPLFVLHMAVVVFPFIEFFKSGNLARFILTVLGVLVPMYALVFCMIYASQGRHGERWRALLERVFRPIPVLGTARRDLALARLAAALEALLNAGVPIIGAWELAATASGSPALRRTVQTWRAPLTEGGSTPSELLSNSGQFPSIFASLYHTGEVSGQLDQTLGRLHTLYLEEGVRRMRLVARWGPQIVYFAVALYVAFRVIQFYTGYFRMIDDIQNIR